MHKDIISPGLNCELHLTERKGRTFIEKIDEELLLKAASLKAGYPISYADSFAAALAKIHNCALLTGDPELKVLEKESIISIVWLTS